MKSRKITSALALAILLAACALPLRRVAAAEQVPLRGTYATSSIITVNFPFVHISTDGVGAVSHLGRTTLHGELDLLIGANTVTGTFTYTAANGDTLTGTISGFIPPPDPQGNVEFDSAVTFTGGTGHFSGASGSAVTHSLGQATGPNSVVASNTITGTVSSVGSN
jgi:hypothetical protein